MKSPRSVTLQLIKVFPKRLEMAKKVCAIDIAEEHLAGIVLEQRKHGYSVLSCHRISCQTEKADLVCELKELVSVMDTSSAAFVCGLPLSWLNVRNLSLPFEDSRKITKALPYELEDQLIDGVEDLLIDCHHIERQGGESYLVAFTLHRERLRHLLAKLQAVNLDPLSVLPGIIPLSRQVASLYDSKWILHLHADISSLDVTLSCNGQCYLYRRLAYPVSDLTQPVVCGEDSQIAIPDLDSFHNCFRTVSSMIKRSVKFVEISGLKPDKPAFIILSGELAGMTELHTILADVLETPVRELDSLSLFTERIEGADRELLRGQYDKLCSLALFGQEKKIPGHFRQGEFARRKTIFSSRRQLAGAGTALLLTILLFFGVIILKSNGLEREKKALQKKMTQLYRQTFPRARKVRDPYVQMKVALKGIKESELSAPVFAGEKRVLEILADISARIPESISLQVARLVIDQKTVRLRGHTDTFNDVDKIKNALSASSRYESVQIVSATANKKSGKIRFELELEIVI
ncbi:MAG: hypothetical protein CSA31_01685 [Desulfobulbus propionicus]|nr:MAG: hypothetical protein CSA31_01685 [Desulfobulbus propionicus]